MSIYLIFFKSLVFSDLYTLKKRLILFFTFFEPNLIYKPDVKKIVTDLISFSSILLILYSKLFNLRFSLNW